MPARRAPRPEALLKKMTLDEKIGQLVQRAGGRSKALNSRLDDAELDRVRAGAVGSYLHVAGAEPLGQAAEGGRRGVAARHPAVVRHGRGPRLSHDLPGAARAGVHLGAREPGARRARGGRRSHLRGPALDLRAHDRHRARSALGPHRRRRGRRSVPRRAHGRGAGERLPGRQPAAARLAHGHRQALRRLRRRHRRPRLQQRRHLRTHAAGSLSTAVLRRGARRRGLVHGGVQRHRRRAHHRQPGPAARPAARTLGLAGTHGQRLGRDRRAHQSRRGGGSRRRGHARARCVGRHGHGRRRVRRRSEGRHREGSRPASNYSTKRCCASCA